MLKQFAHSRSTGLLTLACKRGFSNSITRLNFNPLENKDLNDEIEKLASLRLSHTSIPQLDSEKETKYNLINTFYDYEPKTLTDEAILPGTGRPLPINTELNYYAPLKHEVKYGHLKAELNFKCFDHQNLEFFTDFTLRVAYYLGLPATGPTPLPNRTERWTVNRAPFVHAKSKENFERTTHSRLIRLWDCNPEVVDILLSFIKKNSVWGVGVKCHMYVQEPLNISESMKSIDKGVSALTELTSTVESLSKERQSEVAQRVLELLDDPMFTRHMTADQIKDVKANALKG
ncbi:hypothetical protein CANARDRAFT_10442 [[Candida] arabinofermentans NRRL YB-2248]|uniref:Small ribosomal subunit protein uS10m n=1 Tax=[Candida] arabinofermentans NRRL YB-2248 TaxID=983967 RepID=A0A1E4ST38_9ASCO|nr:hypothetical protein CANARDRAFT_10442 [[Candida] arabinofermentans NRRL YB-2248]